MSEGQVAILLADVALIVLLATLLGRAARAMGQPAVIGEIIAGILVGPTLFDGAITNTVFPADVRPYLGALASLGLTLFMFTVGAEIDFSKLRGSGRVAGAAMIGATVLPFGLGVLLSVHLAAGHPPADPLSFALFIGVAMSVTAFPVLARILTERGLDRSTIGTIALAVAAVCDLVAWTVLAFVQAVAGQHQTGSWLVLLVLPYAALLAGAVRPAVRRLLTTPSRPVSTGACALVLAGALGSATVTQLLGLHFVFGAFLFGLVLPRPETTELRVALLSGTQLGTSVLVSVYFVLAGLNVDLSDIGRAGLIELALIVAVAVIGKFGGTWVGARSQGLSGRSAAVLGTLMNTRGLTELVVLGIGLQIGVLDQSLYSLLVVTAVLTTAMTGPLLNWLGRGRSAGLPTDGRA